jgi:hypothetical protein
MNIPQPIFKYMKNRSNNLIFLLSATFVAFLIGGCGGHHKNQPQNISTGRSFHLIIRATVGGSDLLYDTIYHSGTSPAFAVTDFRYYVSNVKAIRDDGTERKLSRSVVLVDPHQRDYDLGILPEGLYKGLHFTVGLDSAVNHCDPTVFEAGHPLAIQTPSMHWDWNSGYIFMKVEGRVAASKQSASAPGAEIFYHIGMDRMKRDISIQTRFSVGKSPANEMRLKFDLTKMLAGIDMRSEISTHSFDNQPLATRIADNWQGAFSPDN